MNEPSRQLLDLVRRLERTEALDALGAVAATATTALTRDDRVKRVMSGAQLGHRVHPLLTDMPIGAWTSATFLDLFGGRAGRRAARRLVALGIVAAVPTIATGLSDWEDTHGGTRRVGIAHMTSNTIGLTLQIASWLARRRGKHIRGALLGAAGLGAVGVGGYLGGHLVFAARTGVDHEIAALPDDGWHIACRYDELVDDEPIGARVADARIAIVRHAGDVFAIAAVCSHAGGPLDRGRVRGDDPPMIVCPWHGSAFCLEDGAVERGPAASPQPVYETRIRGDVVEVRSVETERLLVDIRR